MDAVGADQHASGGLGTVGEPGNDIAAAMLDRLERLTEFESNAGAFGRVAQRSAERAPHQRDPADRNLGQHPAGLVLKLETIVLETEAVDDVLQTKRMQRGQPARRQVEERPGPISRRGRGLEDDGVDADAPERDPQRRTSDTGADDQHLPCMTMLLFNGPASVDELAAALRPAIPAAVERMQLAGYARFQPGGEPRTELTEHAGNWIERIGAGLRRDGERLLEGDNARTLR